ncbi:MAG: glycosyltransferase family 1 protein [Candidatus Andersenbacteria bacterium CG10_big_fil_rev_8_21_14_0_10_54_11]|uniref:Glycosyltransferase family 1 protein n=1 Tax=Candidatus Andersenbacteria bacterium CG10_big_fil_rev_8_21_14_0_10_54_11 TaxID=1974485 RepID=A0A2M6WZW3_9BACT|nr:MAG: glycosyltransferase family 1 protein [Candidatus Andersenbacteria bacterium CG10_big_fil_rev_8_21_14_0_10_54_11]
MGEAHGALVSIIGRDCMKIGLDVSDLATGRADGTTRYTQELAIRLPVLAPAHEWHYFSPGKFSSRHLASSPNVHISPWPKYWTQLRLPWDLYRVRPDVLLMPIQQLPYLRPGNMGTVAVIHDLAVHYFPEQFTRKDWLLLHTFSAQAAREADQLICVSQATADDVTKFYGRTENVHVIHHGLNQEQFRLPFDGERERSRDFLLQKYPSLQQPYILFVGQIQPRKNLVRLIEAFEQLAGGDDAIHLVIAGGHGWKNESIKQRARTSPIAARIQMIGRVPDELLPALYWQAEVFVLPSLYEGFGLPLLEAMACGCPTVTSNVSSLPEVARIGPGFSESDSYAAQLVNPFVVEEIASGIQEARVNRGRLRQLGLQRAGEFSWEKTAQQTRRVLEYYVE